ncbi:hypothetical protein MTR67_030930 [Solanum verrucosum]|uniref:Uncharacterized protein n=1 Tax=Solanum verrucosum TaxID=315347 RepID=A0AAF0U1I3_SOLVR|nr:hypothetical protein MTR67_030930 [Solanum verrucosum]
MVYYDATSRIGFSHVFIQLAKVIAYTSRQLKFHKKELPGP